MNAYVAAAVKLAGALSEEGSAPAWLARPDRALAAFAVVAGALLAPLSADVLSLDSLVQACSAAFVAVYVTATAAGVRLFGGAARRGAAIACAAVIVVLAFSGPCLAVPAAIALIGAGVRRRRTPAPACEQVSAAAS